ncbi:hypothetical protein B0T18DRAFT_387965 [Schizothecium vesticola]|uniref:Uncharacterized protein n=1 Tax=Schizothecium vesticola TaxID=314040 RepID=A0AA40F669_9PEZI|nr:hypothetical protein B0T18DRAFT_387965 [Schizothecium vesticola]
MCQPHSYATGHGPIVYSFLMMCTLSTVPGTPSPHDNVALPVPMGLCLNCGTISSFGSLPDDPSTPLNPSPPRSPEPLFPEHFKAPVAPATSSNFVQEHVRMDIDDEVIESLTELLKAVSLDSNSQLQGEMSQGLFGEHFKAPVAPDTNSNVVQEYVRMDIDDEDVESLTELLKAVSLDSNSQLPGEMS